jgi:hypothetical protein
LVALRDFGQYSIPSARGCWPLFPRKGPLVLVEMDHRLTPAALRLLVPVMVASTSRNNGYKGNPLPEGCPPSDSVTVPAGYLLRLVSTNPCTADDFRSGHAEGKNQPRKCDLCTWLSCSVWTADTPLEDLAGLAKLRTLSHMKFVARFKVTGLEGKSNLTPRTRGTSASGCWNPSPQNWLSKSTCRYERLRKISDDCRGIGRI